MADNDVEKAKQAAKDLLLADYKYFSELFWRNEQTGETRVNWFIGIVSAATAGLVALVTKHAEQVAAFEAATRQGDPTKTPVPPALSAESLRAVLLAALIALIIFGVITLFRMMTRNKTTDDYKKALDTVRETFRDSFDPQQVLRGYYPFGIPKKEKADNEERTQEKTKELRKLGGLVYMVAVINSVLVGALVAAYFYNASLNSSDQTTRLFWSALGGTLASFAAMWGLIAYREWKTNKDRDSEDPTHAGGIVFAPGTDGAAEYLIIRDTPNKEWVLPKGKLRPGEGHADAALREVLEETGVIARILAPVGRIDFADVRAKFYLMEKMLQGTAKEKRDPKWLSFDEARNTLTHGESQQMLEIAEAWRNRINQSQVQSISS